MFRSDGQRRTFSLSRDITVIGRRDDCDLRIPLGEVSRKHCRLIKEGELLRLEDLGSSNGTYHNGQRIQEANIQPGDSIQVGSVGFVVQIDGVPAADEMQPQFAGQAVSAPEESKAPLDLGDAADSAAAISNSASGSAFDFLADSQQGQNPVASDQPGDAAGQSPSEEKKS